MPLFLANGIVSIVFFTSCYTAAIRYTKIATAAALLYTAPAIVLILSAILFKEKLTGKKIICVLFSVLGCALCSGLAGGADPTRKGLLLGLGAGLGYALYSIFSRYIRMRGYTTYTNILYTFGIATIVYVVMACVDGSAQNSIQHPEAIALAALCGLVTGCAAYILYTEGLSKMAPPTASVLATIEPVTLCDPGSCTLWSNLIYNGDYGYCSCSRIRHCYECRTSFINYYSLYTFPFIYLTI